MIPFEIERKFLLKSLPNILPKDYLFIEQFYFDNNGIWERIRKSRSDKTGLTTFFHTIKTHVEEGVNLEDERTISEGHFNELHTKCSIWISKTRHIYPEGERYWEVDVFNGYNLIVAEIEIPTKTFQVEIPKYIEDVMLLEVTGLPQFSNRNLSKKINN